MPRPQKNNAAGDDHCSAERHRRAFFAATPGSYWNPKLTIIKKQNGDRTVIATADIQPSEVLAILPPGSGVPKPDHQSIPCSVHLDPDLSLAGSIYCLLNAGEMPRSTLANHYLSTLPAADWYATHHPVLRLYLSCDERQRQQLTPHFYLFHHLQQIERWLDHLPEQERHLEQAHRAVLVATSRAWGCGLLPYLDFFQHANDGPLLGQGQSLHANRLYQEGDEVYANYGPKDSFQLFCQYGFSQQETTVAIPQPRPSGFALALDPDLQELCLGDLARPLLIDEAPPSLDPLLRLSRLSVMASIDTLGIDDLASNHRHPINADNERRALRAIYRRFLDHTRSAEECSAALPPLEAAEPFRDQLHARLLVLKSSISLIENHWLSLLNANL